jgi:hypothetical protein
VGKAQSKEAATAEEAVIVLAGEVSQSWLFRERMTINSKCESTPGLAEWQTHRCVDDILGMGRGRTVLSSASHSTSVGREAMGCCTRLCGKTGPLE